MARAPNAEGAAEATPSASSNELDLELALQRTATVETGRVHDDTCACRCWHCTAGPAVDRAITSGERVVVDTTDQLVIPDVLAVELAANGIAIDDYGSYRVTHRSGNRTAWILSPGAVL